MSFRSEVGVLISVLAGLSVSSCGSDSGPAAAAAIPDPEGILLTTHQAADLVIGQADFTSSTVETVPTESGWGGIYGAAAFSSDGTLLLPDYGFNRILGFSVFPSENGASADLVIGQDDFESSTPGSAADALSGPQSLHIVAGMLLVTDLTNSRVLIYSEVPTERTDADFILGQADFGLGSPVTTCDATHLSGPEDAFIVGTKLIVADSNHHRILIWNDWEEKGAGGAGDKTADIVIGQPDFTTCTPQSAAANSDTVARSSYLNYPTGVWSDGQQLFVEDSLNNRLLVWNAFPQGDIDGVGNAPSFILGSADGTSGTTQTTFNNPFYLTSNGTQLFVSDKGNGRVLVWNTLPTLATDKPEVVLGQADFTSFTDSTNLPVAPTSQSMYAPAGVYADTTRLIVTDSGNNRYLIFNGN